MVENIEQIVNKWELSKWDAELLIQQGDAKYIIYQNKLAIEQYYSGLKVISIPMNQMLYRNEKLLIMRKNEKNN